MRQSILAAIPRILMEAPSWIPTLPLGDAQEPVGWVGNVALDNLPFTASVRTSNRETCSLDKTCRRLQSFEGTNWYSSTDGIQSMIRHTYSVLSTIMISEEA